MRSALNTVGFIAAFASGAIAATSTFDDNIWATEDIQGFVTQFAPSATSVSPSQLSKLYSDINKYETAWEGEQPPDPAYTDTSISFELYSAIEDAEYNAFATPSAGLASLSVLASGLPESAALMSYESSLIAEGQTWTTQISRIIASDLGQVTSTPTDGPSSGPVHIGSTTAGSSNTDTAAANTATSTASSISSALAAAPTAGAGVMAGAVVAAAGVVGMALL